MQRKNIFLWTLYDFANSISTIAFFLYFSQWLVVENHVADIWFNLLFVGSTILLLVTVPIFASAADKNGRWMPSLRITTVLQFILLFIISWLCLFLPPTKELLIVTSILFLFANYFYQFSLIFYSAFLPAIAKEKQLGFVSGIGQCANWLGSLAGVLVTLPFVTGVIFLFGNSGRVQAFLPATIIALFLSLPMLFFFKENVKQKSISINIISEYKHFFQTLTSVWKIPGLGRFFLGYFFFSDALTTASNNFAIYLEQVFKISDQTKSLLLLNVLITSAVGAVISGWVSDKVGLKKSMMYILGSWIFIFPAMAFVENFSHFVFLATLMGFFFGATWSVTRAIVAYLAPADKRNNAFSYYVLFERFGTLVGPLTWGFITMIFMHTGSMRYRIALFSMTVFIIIGLFIVRNIPNCRPTR